MCNAFIANLRIQGPGQPNVSQRNRTSNNFKWQLNLTRGNKCSTHSGFDEKYYNEPNFYILDLGWCRCLGIQVTSQCDFHSRSLVIPILYLHLFWTTILLHFIFQTREYEASDYLIVKHLIVSSSLNKVYFIWCYQQTISHQKSMLKYSQSFQKWSKLFSTTMKENIFYNYVFRECETLNLKCWLPRFFCIIKQTRIMDSRHKLWNILGNQDEGLQTSTSNLVVYKRYFNIADPWLSTVGHGKHSTKVAAFDVTVKSNPWGSGTRLKAWLRTFPHR